MPSFRSLDCSFQRSFNQLLDHHFFLVTQGKKTPTNMYTGVHTLICKVNLTGTAATFYFASSFSKCDLKSS